MRYMLMLYADEKAGAAIPRDQMARAVEGMYAYADTLRQAGAFVDTRPLAPTWEAKTIGMEGGEIVRRGDAFVNEGGELRVHDGPYAETREQFGGYYIIEAPDMAAALDWARKCPAAQWGPIQVRPFLAGF
jgi:hypothetical protein